MSSDREEGEYTSGSVKLSRRRFLGVSTAAAAGGIVGGIIVGAVGGYLAGQAAAPKVTTTETRTVTTTQAPGAPTTITQTVTQPTTVTQTRTATVTATQPVTTTVTATQPVTTTVTQTAPEPRLPKIRIGSVAYTGMVPTQIAYKEGFLKAQGLDAEVVMFASGAAALEGLLGGAVECIDGASYGSWFMSLAKDIPLVAAWTGLVTETSDRPDQQVLIRKDHYDAGIKRIADIKGRESEFTIGYVVGTIREITLKILFEDAGVSWDKVKKVNLRLAETAAAFAGKKIDLAATMPPFSKEAEIKGVGVPISNDHLHLWEKIFNVDFATSNQLLFRKDFVDSNPEAVRRVMRAYMQAFRWMIRNPDGVRRMWKETTGLSDEILSRISIPPIEEAFPLYQEQVIADLAYEHGIIGKKISLESYAFTDMPRMRPPPQIQPR